MADMAFDWLSLSQVQKTRDKVIQESVLLYNPAREAVVFVFLLSASANSMAAWRFKLLIPGEAVTRHAEHIEHTVKGIKTPEKLTYDQLSGNRAHPFLLYSYAGQTSPASGSAAEEEEVAAVRPLGLQEAAKGGCGEQAARRHREEAHSARRQRARATFYEGCLIAAAATAKEEARVLCSTVWIVYPVRSSCCVLLIEYHVRHVRYALIICSDRHAFESYALYVLDPKRKGKYHFHMRAVILHLSDRHREL